MDEPEASPPAGWLESLMRSKAQIEAGEIVPMEPFIARLRASISRMEARRRKQPKRSTRKA
jgi:hypothetical protein